MIQRNFHQSPNTAATFQRDASDPAKSLKLEPFIIVRIKSNIDEKQMDFLP
jgi:hypothetical protein